MKMCALLFYNIITGFYFRLRDHLDAYIFQSLYLQIYNNAHFFNYLLVVYMCRHTRKWINFPIFSCNYTIINYTVINENYDSNVHYYYI